MLGRLEKAAEARARPEVQEKLRAWQQSPNYPIYSSVVRAKGRAIREAAGYP